MKAIRVLGSLKAEISSLTISAMSLGGDHQSSLILELRAVSTKTAALISSKIRMSGTSTSAMSPARKTVCRAETK